MVSQFQVSVFITFGWYCSAVPVKNEPSSLLQTIPARRKLLQQKEAENKPPCAGEVEPFECEMASQNDGCDEHYAKNCPQCQECAAALIQTHSSGNSAVAKVKPPCAGEVEPFECEMASQNDGCDEHYAKNCPQCQECAVKPPCAGEVEPEECEMASQSDGCDEHYAKNCPQCQECAASLIQSTRSLRNSAVAKVKPPCAGEVEKFECEMASHNDGCDEHYAKNCPQCQECTAAFLQNAKSSKGVCGSEVEEEECEVASQSGGCDSNPTYAANCHQCKQCTTAADKPACLGEVEQFECEMASQNDGCDSDARYAKNCPQCQDCV